MPNCNHPGASCVVGNFWTCKTQGCANGPAQVKAPTKQQDLVINFTATPVQPSVTGNRILIQKQQYTDQRGTSWTAEYWQEPDGNVVCQVTKHGAIDGDDLDTTGP